MKLIILLVMGLNLVSLTIVQPVVAQNQQYRRQPPQMHKSAYLDPFWNYWQTNKFPEFVWDGDEWIGTQRYYARDNDSLNATANFGFGFAHDLGLNHITLNVRGHLCDKIRDEDLLGIKAKMTWAVSKWTPGAHVPAAPNSHWATGEKEIIVDGGCGIYFLGFFLLVSVGYRSGAFVAC